MIVSNDSIKNETTLYNNTRNLKVNISNSLGQSIFVKDLVVNRNQDKIFHNMFSYPKGVYFAQVMNQKFKYSSRFIKQ